MAYRLTQTFAQLPQTAADHVNPEAGREDRAPRISVGLRKWRKTVAAVGPATAARLPQSAANCRSKRGFAAVVYTPLKGGYNPDCRTPQPRLLNRRSEAPHA